MGGDQRGDDRGIPLRGGQFLQPLALFALALAGAGHQCPALGGAAAVALRTSGLSTRRESRMSPTTDNRVM